MSVLNVWINCADRAGAEAIAAHLIAARLAAAVNLYPPIESVYRWQGELRRTVEYPLLVRTRTTLFAAVVAAVRDRHPYQTPSIVGIEATDATSDYRAWLEAETLDPAVAPPPAEETPDE